MANIKIIYNHYLLLTKIILIIPFLIFSNSVFANSSLYEIGKAFYYGDGVEQDYEKALFAFEQNI